MKAALLAEPHATRRTAGGAFPRLWQFASEYLIALPVGALVALVWANVEPESYFAFAFANAFLVNDVAMVCFFAIIAKEIVEATAVNGYLHAWRRAAMPVVASFGVVLASLLAFSVLARVVDEPMLVRGWAATFAIDLAAGYLVCRMVFGRHAAIPFFLLLGISANGLGFIALAVSDPVRESRPEVAVPLMAAALAVTFTLRKAGVRTFVAYIATGGVLSWYALLEGGFHPALALLPIVPFMPHAARDPGFFVDAPPHARDPLNRLEIWFRHPAQLALFSFGLVNGGVPLPALEVGVWTLPIALLLARPLGLFAGSAAGLALGLRLPRGIGARELTVIGLISGTGFTMALFFATSILGPGPLLSELKVGALLSLGAGVAAVAAARTLRVGRFAR